MPDPNAAFNLVELRRYKGVKVELLENHLRIIYPSAVSGVNGRFTGFAPPPQTIEVDRLHPATERLSPSERLALTSDDSYLAAAQALRALDSWGVAVAAAAANRNLSDSGRHDAIVAATGAGLRAVGVQFAGLEKIAAALAEKHATLYRVPATTDSAIDIENRALWRAMSDSDRFALLLRAKEPENEPLLLALLRAWPPLRGKEGEVLGSAWTERIVSQKPEEAATLVLAEEANAWAVSLAKFLGSQLANPNTSGTNGAFDALAIYQTLREAKATGLLEYDVNQVAMFERRIAAIAA